MSPAKSRLDNVIVHFLAPSRGILIGESPRVASPDTRLVWPARLNGNLKLEHLQFFEWIATDYEAQMTSGHTLF
jgi:hypothetical protein